MVNRASVLSGWVILAGLLIAGGGLLWIEPRSAVVIVGLVLAGVGVRLAWSHRSK